MTASPSDHCPNCGAVLGHLRGGCDACGATFLRSAEIRAPGPFFFGMKIRLPRGVAKKHGVRLARDARKRRVRELGRHDRWWLLGKYGTTDGTAIFAQDMIESHKSPFRVASQITVTFPLDAGGAAALAAFWPGARL